MITHDFHCPIPPSTVRVSVILGGDSFTVDLPSAKLGDTLQAFEDHCGPLSTDRCAEVAAALWLFLFQPGAECEINTDRLAEMIKANGSALLTAMACETTGEWTFKLFAMPRWPAVVAPYRATERDRRRRWR
jgi:hypothetical protein